MNEALRKFIDMHPELDSAPPEAVTALLIEEISKLRAETGA